MTLKRSQLKRKVENVRAFQQRARRPLKRGRRQKDPVSLSTRVIAMNRTAYKCSCGCGRMANSLHHAFPRQRFPELTNEPDNCIPLAWEPCHSNHETALHSLARSVIAPAERLATTSAREAYLDRTYGPRGVESPGLPPRQQGERDVCTDTPWYG